MNFKILLFMVLFFPLFTIASPYSEEFDRLEEKSNQTPEIKISALLKPYGEVSDFKISNESKNSEKCAFETRIRASVICNKKEKITALLYFAEGKGLLCKIYDNLNSIKCLSKQPAQ